jgi:hypothetical protein
MTEPPPYPRLAAPLLAEALTDRNAQVRRTAPLVLESIARDLEDASLIQGAVEPLTESLSDPDPAVRENALFGLAQLAPDIALELLPKYLGDRDPGVRLRATQLFEYLAQNAFDEAMLGTAIAGLCQAVRNRDPAIRSVAAAALGECAARAYDEEVRRRAIQVLTAALHDRDRLVRLVAERALETIARTPRPDHPLVGPARTRRHGQVESPADEDEENESASGPEAPVIEIAREGRALVPIVVDDTEGIEEAVQDLAEYLGKLTGGQFEVVKAADYQGGPAIHVDTDYFEPSDEDVQLDRWMREQVVRVYTDEEGLYVTGGGRSGCVYAVYAFLEDLCGVRWFHPGRLGEYVPSKPDLAFGRLNVRQVPSFLHRRMWASPSLRDERMCEEHRVWMRRNRQGGPEVLAKGDLLRLAVPESGDEGPALLPFLGSPAGSPPGQAGVSDPEAVKVVVERVREAFDEDPDRYSFSLGVEDSRAPVPSVDASGQETPLAAEEPDLDRTRRFLDFANRVADEIGKTHPDRHLVLEADETTFEPPKETPLSPLVIPSLRRAGRAGDPFHPILAAEEVSPSSVFYRTCIRGWRALSDKLFAREDWTAPQADPLLKAGVAPVLFKDVPYYLEDGFLGITSEADLDWGIVALNHYVASKLMWDAKRERLELLSDYFDKYYGAASQPMRAYFTRIWAAAYRAHLPGDRARPLTDSDLAYLDAALSQAVVAAREDELRAARVRLARDFFDVYRLRRAILAGRLEPAAVQLYLSRLDGLAAERSDALVVETYKRELMPAEPEAGPTEDAAGTAVAPTPDTVAPQPPESTPAQDAPPSPH